MWRELPYHTYRQLNHQCITLYTLKIQSAKSRPLCPRFQLSTVYCGPQKFRKIREQMVHKFKNPRQGRTGCNMVKSSSPNAPSTWFIFLCPRNHTSPQTCHHSASSVLAVRISCHAIAVFMFRKQKRRMEKSVNTHNRLKYFLTKFSHYRWCTATYVWLSL